MPPSAGVRSSPCSAPGPLAVRGTPAELEALVGQTVTAIRRRGKFLMIDLDRDRVVVNPMLTGRFQLAGPGVKLPAKTAVVLGFGPLADRGRFRPAAWTRDAAWLPAADDASRDPLPRPDPDGQGLPAARRASSGRCPGLGDGEIGPDVDDPALTLEAWRERIRRHPGELKNLLRNQAFVAGIGNAYSDEILHAARLLPFRKRSTPGRRGGRRALRGDANDGGRRDRGPAPARPADVRDAGARLPRGPHEGRAAVSALRDPDHRGQGRRLRDVVLPRLPALSARSGQLAGPGRPAAGADCRCR